MDLEVWWLFSVELAFKHRLVGEWVWTLLGLLLYLFTWINLLSFREDLPRFCHTACRAACLTSSSQKLILGAGCWIPCLLCSPAETSLESGPHPSPSLPCWGWWCRRASARRAGCWALGSSMHHTAWALLKQVSQSSSKNGLNAVKFDDSRRAEEFLRRTIMSLSL